LIALVQHDEVVVGVISAPALARRWWAGTGLGAWSRALNGPAVRMKASGVRSLADASFSFSDAIGWGSSGPGLAALQQRTWRQRGYGDFWSHMLVAEGHVDIAAEPELDIWDLAALVPVVEEAGGTITPFSGDSGILSGAGAVSTNGLLHEAASRIIRP
ncbi:MAG: inositol monophosphatase family protein, partial [Actinomycetota bacterium]